MTDLSDHIPVFFIIGNSIKRQRTKTVYKLIRKTDDIKIKEIAEKLSEYNWSDCQSPDPNLALDSVVASINMYYVM